MDKKYRIDTYIFSCQNVNDVVSQIQKTQNLKKVYYKHLFKKYYKNNTFVIDKHVKVYLNHEPRTDCVFMSLENNTSNLEDFLRSAYEIYDGLQNFFPTRLKLKTFLNKASEKLTYNSFAKEITEFYK